MSPSLITTTSTTATRPTNSQNPASEHTDTINLTEPIGRTTNRDNQIDLVDEMVEQALVDNLLDGNYYTGNHQASLVDNIPESTNNFGDENQSSNQRFYYSILFNLIESISLFEFIYFKLKQ